MSSLVHQCLTESECIFNLSGNSRWIHHFEEQFNRLTTNLIKSHENRDQQVKHRDFFDLMRNYKVNTLPWEINPMCHSIQISEPNGPQTYKLQNEVHHSQVIDVLTSNRSPEHEASNTCIDYLPSHNSYSYRSESRSILQAILRVTNYPIQTACILNDFSKFI